ncbi:UV radiation resistance associated protein [Acanthamoeba castellanii str. Neff]|uniref:UV radiation resistance associated protein n=1 Tax=Acanthamoeba castellanii (strain ATCC 30010 / Neff) TaxID=1257118 RepID=L8H1V8_ACACF|nr:UV radiation resistance associated protein [Acanthamoeba castellanii str. Neff]ELR19484.1 UV radiation resistance associated protein [Acanthamoeba castellanii str. Neff]
MPIQLDLAPYVERARTSKWKRVDIPLLVNKYRRAQADNAAMQNRIEERITAQLRHRELLMRKQVLLLRVQKARERVAEHAQWMERENRRVRAQRQQTQEKMKHLKQAIYNLENSKNSLHNDSLYKSGLLEQRKELALIRSQLLDKKKELVFELLTILPILPVNDQQCRVINIVLPNNGDYASVPRGVLAAALGYVVHIVKMIAGYLGVVLPFRMESRGSQSIIYKEGSSTKYPLYLQSNERELWTAVTALNINVAYLCASQGFLPGKHQIPQTLLNLRRLLQSPNLGADTPPRKWHGLGRDKQQAEKDPTLGDWEFI